MQSALRTPFLYVPRMDKMKMTLSLFKHVCKTAVFLLLTGSNIRKL